MWLPPSSCSARWLTLASPTSRLSTASSKERSADATARGIAPSRSASSLPTAAAWRRSTCTSTSGPARVLQEPSQSCHRRHGMANAVALLPTLTRRRRSGSAKDRRKTRPPCRAPAPAAPSTTAKAQLCGRCSFNMIQRPSAAACSSRGAR